MLKIIALAFVTTVESKKKKKPRVVPGLDANDRFLDIEREMYCIACKSYISAVRAELKNTKNTEMDVVNAMLSSCSENKIGGYYKYYGADRLAMACKVFREDWDEILEAKFINWSYNSTQEGVESICEEETLSCKDFNEEKFAKPRFYLDGVEQDSSMVTYGSSNDQPSDTPREEP